MTIRHAAPEVEIKDGDFILGASITAYGLCSRPGKVTHISGKRIYYDRFHTDGVIDSTHMNRDQVRFICDAKEEVDSLMFLSDRKQREITAAVQNVEQAFGAQYDIHLSNLIKGAA